MSAIPNALKTHCNQGHPLSGDNLYLQKGRYGRKCRTCNRERVSRLRRARGCPERPFQARGDVPHKLYVEGPANECWPWLGSHTPDGYGKCGGRPAYRVVYERLVGRVPAGLTLDHLCRNHACVNPAHLEPVTHRENILRGLGPSATAARRDCCVRGHAYDEANTYRDPKKPGVRICRACVAASQRRRQRRIREAARAQQTTTGGSGPGQDARS